MGKLALLSPAAIATAGGTTISLGSWLARPITRSSAAGASRLTVPGVVPRPSPSAISSGSARLRSGASSSTSSRIACASSPPAAKARISTGSVSSMEAFASATTGKPASRAPWGIVTVSGSEMRLAWEVHSVTSVAAGAELPSATDAARTPPSSRVEAGRSSASDAAVVSVTVSARPASR